MNGAPWWVSVASTLLTFAGGYLVYRQAGKATKNDTSRVDAEAYKTAKGFYEGMLEERKSQTLTQQAQIDQLNSLLLEQQRQLNGMQEQLNLRLSTETDLRRQLISVEQRLANSKNRIEVLEETMRSNDITVPPVARAQE